MEETTILGIRAKVARTFAERARGLIGRPAPARGEGMLILRCNAIHTFFMRYPIDAIFLDSRGNVVKAVRNIRPWRFFVWGGWKARQVLETSPGVVSLPTEDSAIERPSRKECAP